MRKERMTMHHLTATLICMGGHDYIRDCLMRRKKSGQKVGCAPKASKKGRKNHNPRYLYDLKVLFGSISIYKRISAKPLRKS